MSDYTDVPLSGGGGSAVFRIFPSFCTVLYGGKVAVGQGRLTNLFEALQDRCKWDGTYVVVDPPSWFGDKTAVEIRLANKSIKMHGSRKALMQALTEVFLANT